MPDVLNNREESQAKEPFKCLNRQSYGESQALRLIDQAVQARESRVLPLADELAETAAVSDLCQMLRKLTRGEMDLTGVYPTSDWLDALLFPWIDGAAFVDPPAGCLFPAVSGAVQ